MQKKCQLIPPGVHYKCMGKFIYRASCTGAFKKRPIIWVFEGTSYGGGLRGLQHPSQQEAGSFTQGALR